MVKNLKYNKDKIFNKDNTLTAIGEKVKSKMLQDATKMIQNKVDKDELSGMVFIFFEKENNYDPMIAGSVPVFSLRKCLLEMIEHIEKEEIKDAAVH